MKARVKATGEIVSVKVVETGCDYKGRQIFVYEDDKRRCFADSELDFDSPDNTPEDYWTRLEHQYAGMAMQGILAKYGVEPLPDDAAHDAYNYAHALVEKYKKEK